MTLSSFGEIRVYPTTDKMPEATPTANASPGDITAKLAAVPIATPPARVAFCTSTLQNSPPRIRFDATKAVTHEPTSERRVAMRQRSWSSATAGAETNEGQKTKRKIVPIIANKSEW